MKNIPKTKIHWVRSTKDRKLEEKVCKLENIVTNKEKVYNIQTLLLKKIGYKKTKW